MSHLLRIAGLLALASMVSGCLPFYLLHLPGPHVHKDGLGLSRIGDYVRLHTWVGSVDKVALKDGLTSLIAERTPPNGLSREAAEELGMLCAPAPSTECTFLGERSYRSHNLPRDDRLYGKTTIQTIEVRFSYLKPQGLVVKVQEQEISEE